MINKIVPTYTSLAGTGGNPLLTSIGARVVVEVEPIPVRFGLVIAGIGRS